MNEDSPDRDPGANTERWQKFVEEAAPPAQRSGASFRLLTLIGGLAVFALLIWLLLR